MNSKIPEINKYHVDRNSPLPTSDDGIEDQKVYVRVDDTPFL
ncbi:MAG: hypothetical protein ACRD8W_15970 [Nitrososphaeraceae archaeon]